MAEPQAHSQPIETYGLAPHNRNIWPSPTPTANQYKHMAQRRIIETYGRAPRPQPTNTNIWQTGRRHVWPILLFVLVSPVISLLTRIESSREIIESHLNAVKAVALLANGH